jgi:uncharacterized protein (UPF0276 family)
LGVGLQLVSGHYRAAVENPPEGVDFYELISENFMETAGYPLYLVDRLAERFPVLLHGVQMDIAGPAPLDRAYLQRLKALARRAKASFVSDHLCWTRLPTHNTHDLLPVPLTEEALAYVAERVRIVQDVLEMPLVLENASTYLQFAASMMEEGTFLARLAETADCGILLDVNNVYVSAFNHGYDPLAYIASIPMDRVVYHHVAGHTREETFIRDSHADHVSEEVWRLYEHVHALTGGRSTLVEWDVRTPAFEVVVNEVRKIPSRMAVPGPAAAPPAGARPSGPLEVRDTRGATPLAELQRVMLERVVAPEPPGEAEWVHPTETSAERLRIHWTQYRYQMRYQLGCFFPACRRLLGEEAFREAVLAYVARHRPDHWNVYRLRDRFPEFVRDHLDDPRAGFLYDLARVERAGREVGDEVEPGGPPPWVEEGRVGPLHPAIRLLVLEHDVLPFIHGAAAPELGPGRTYVLICRQRYVLKRVAIGRSLHRLLRLVSRGVPLERAAQRVGGRKTDDLLRAVRAAGLIPGGAAVPTR